MTITQRIRPFLDEAIKRAAQASLLEEQAAAAEVKIAFLRVEDTQNEQARMLLVEAGSRARARVRETLESVVTRALQAVYDDSYRFVLEFKEDGREPEVRFEVMRGDPPVQDEPTESMGGGVVDVVSLALRVAYQILYGIGGPLLLDEPGRHLDNERASRLAQLLRELSEEFDLQIILVTHNESLAHNAERAYLVTHNGRHSEVALL